MLTNGIFAMKNYIEIITFNTIYYSDISIFHLRTPPVPDMTSAIGTVRVDKKHLISNLKTGVF